jgi:hypothetical protein
MDLAHATMVAFSKTPSPLGPSSMQFSANFSQALKFDPFGISQTISLVRLLLMILYRGPR